MFRITFSWCDNITNNVSKIQLNFMFTFTFPWCDDIRNNVSKIQLNFMFRITFSWCDDITQKLSIKGSIVFAKKHFNAKNAASMSVFFVLKCVLVIRGTPMYCTSLLLFFFLSKIKSSRSVTKPWKKNSKIVSSQLCQETHHWFSGLLKYEVRKQPKRVNHTWIIKIFLRRIFPRETFLVVLLLWCHDITECTSQMCCF